MSIIKYLLSDNKDDKIVEFIKSIDNSTLNTMIDLAVQSISLNNEEVFDKLLPTIDVNWVTGISENTLLMHSVSKRKPKFVKKLIENGAIIDTYNRNNKYRAIDIWNFLNEIPDDIEECIKLLIQSGANIDPRNIKILVLIKVTIQC